VRLKAPVISEREKRDQILDRLQEKRKELIEIAKKTAHEIADAGLVVTSPMVLELMRERGVDFANLDTRFMGVVFRSGWVRVGFVPEGSHAQPISLWRRK